jgi:hypothetical protein
MTGEGDSVTHTQHATRTSGPAPVPGFDDAHESSLPTPEPREPVDPDSVSLPLAKVRRYKELRDLQKTSEAEADAFKEEANAIEAELIEAFADAGLQNVNIDGRTVYLHRSVFAMRRPGVTAEDVIEALRADGAGDLVRDTVNANTLSAWVRELCEDDDAPGLPEHAAAVLEPGEKFSVRIIAGGTKAKSKTHSKG